MNINIPELNKWAELNFNKDNATLVADGAKLEKMTKVRAYLRAIIDRCKIFMSTTEKNNRFLKDIEDYIGELTKLGLMVPKTKDEIVSKEKDAED